MIKLLKKKLLLLVGKLLFILLPIIGNVGKYKARIYASLHVKKIICNNSYSFLERDGKARQRKAMCTYLKSGCKFETHHVSKMADIHELFVLKSRRRI